MSDPQIGLGDTHTWTPFNPTGPKLSTDGQVASIVQAAKGGPDTTAYFNRNNMIGQLYQKIASEGDAAWVEETDLNNNPMYVISMRDGNHNSCYIQLSFPEVKADTDGHVIPNGEKFKLNGVDYTGVGFFCHAVGYNNYTFSQTSRKLGYAAVGAAGTKLAMKFLLPRLKSIALAGKNAITNGYKKIASRLSKGSVTEGQAQQDAVDATNNGERELTEAGITTDEVAAETAGIALGTVFVGVAVFIGLVFVGVSFLLHNSFHFVRLWNLTRYNMEWWYWFDTDEGKLINGPGVQNDAGTKIIPVDLPGASIYASTPTARPMPHASYGDIQVVSSSETHGIGYVLQLNLKDPGTGKLVHSVQIYYDIPLDGKNSTGLTFNVNPDTQQWYKDNQGNNKSVYASATTFDGQVVAHSSYDFLDGKHPNPALSGGSTNEGYNYQSMLVIEEPNLQLSDLPIFPSF